ncbi:SRPBCC family protein [Streptomyces fuscigenes]|uniref:SRPBCC family protein n=1 Tax=Streptomyces fuscigenes TaxID=1528880 RepID=UPI001F3C5C67|nr:SRPBCC family protein [Streptomyces fuscigenes]MCF3965019.1 SRPBCC family protein [Streptomyces fuscigenes]
MAVRHRYVDRAPDALWAVLNDPYRFGDWVVGTSSSRPEQGDWPQLGSSLRYTVRLGPKTFEGSTVVRRYEPPGILELEAHAGPLGTARIAFDIRRWGDGTLVIVDEHPLRGIGGSAHNGIVDRVIQLRHRQMLKRLEQAAEDEPVGPARRDAHA